MNTSINKPPFWEIRKGGGPITDLIRKEKYLSLSQIRNQLARLRCWIATSEKRLRRTEDLQLSAEVIVTKRECERLEEAETSMELLVGANRSYAEGSAIRAHGRDGNGNRRIGKAPPCP